MSPAPEREPPPSAPLSAILSPGAQLALRREIAAAGGEVLFFGTLDGQGVVVEIDVIARGNRESVPMLHQRASGYDVAIHNHPSGNLLPSSADLSIAHALAREGLGFLIVDDAVTRVHEVIPARVARPRARVEPAEIDAFLGPAGPLAAVLGDDYEPRPAQLHMSRQVALALSDDAIALLEAGTGTGKTFAYLVPGALYALRNKLKVVISTATKNLQGQIVEKDVPHLRLALGELGDELEVAVVKGRGNYVSLRRAAEAGKGDPALFADDDELLEVKRLSEWAETTASGERSELVPLPRAEAWEQVASTPDDCLGPRCPTFQRCHYFNARRAAAKAHLIVVNHHLLFSDLALKGELGYDRPAVLPPFAHVVLDEAHHVEATASEHFGLALTHYGLTRPLGRLRLRGRSERGLFPSLLRALLRAPGGALDRLARELEERLYPLADQTRDTLELSLGEVAAAVREAAGEREREAKLRLHPSHAPLLEPLGDAQQGLAILAARLGRWSDEVRDRLGEDEELTGAIVPLLRQLDSANAQLSRGASGLKAFLETTGGGPTPAPADDEPGPSVGTGDAHGAGTPNEDAEGKRQVAPGPPPVSWAEVSRGRLGRDRLRLRLAPLEVGPQLVAALFRPARSVVLTSATLTVRGRTEYLEGRLGIAGPPERDPAQPPPFERVLRAQIPSPFDYPRQALLAVPTDLPPPEAPEYAAAVSDALRELLRCSRGRAFCLFTAYGQLNRSYLALHEELEHQGLVPLRQGDESRAALLSRFRTTPGAVLFGTDSFWEGVDVPGDALVLVCIARLPFGVPTEPLWQARAEAIERRGGNAFQELQLPRAVLKLTQGFGRLIRTHSDQGAVVVLDKRLVTKWYGRAFLDSLPEVRVEAAPLLDLFPILRRYLR
ncbi:MAG: helicase C-terminal domain-containing protein [Planctomycetota bacterium]